ncbi:hypothetical protein SEPCBS119000_006102 [Sporothrix epigloea]|uniref:Kelch repeat protein n=1 Tax=Sporothrix epigloea TaxID=1892477 RepID=A0ABP0E1I3_9PEZI
MPDPGRQTPRSPQRVKVMRSQKIEPATTPAENEVAASSLEAISGGRRSSNGSSRRQRDEQRDRSGSTASTASLAVTAQPPGRSHTPSHLSTKSQDQRRKAAELSIRQRSQSSSSLSAAAASSVAAAPAGDLPASSHLTVAGSKAPSRSSALITSISSPSVSARASHRGSHNITGNDVHSSGSGSDSPAQAPALQPEGSGSGPRRPSAMRSTSAIASKPSISGNVAGEAAKSTVRSGSVSDKNLSRGAHPLAKSGSRAGDGYTAFPPLADPELAPDVLPAPSSGMYWTRTPVSGVPHPPLRAHTATLIGSNIFVFGGCDARTCFSDLYVLDADSFHWTKPHVVGEIPLPLRAMTCTAVGKKLVVFGGGDGPLYYNDVYVLDTTNFRWSRPRISAERPMPPRRRAHTACLYKNGIYIFGGGDGIRALNDVWRLDVADVSKMSWRQISGMPQSPLPDADRASGGDRTDGSSETTPGASSRSAAGLGATDSGLEGHSEAAPMGSTATAGKNGPSTPTPSATSSTTYFTSREDPATTAFLNQPHLLNQARPKARGYHTANIVGTKLIIFGGSDGGECFNDVWVYDVETHLWRAVSMPVTHRRLSHTATIVGSYLFVIGGHDGTEYSNEVLLLNLVTMLWDRRKVYGLPPSGRGYHSTVLYDSRLLLIGGFDGNEVFGDVWTLELAVHAYYSQISHFTIEV